MNNLTKEKKQQLGLVAIITLVVLSGLWFGLVDAQKKSRANIQKTIEKIGKDIEKGEKLRDRAGEIAAALEKNQQEIANRESSMPPFPTAYQWLIGIINPYLNRPGSSLGNFGTQTPALGTAGILPKFPYKAATYNVSMNGYYDDFGKFLADFENDWPYLRVQNLNLKAPATAGDEKLDIQFEVVSLTLTNAAPAAPSR